MVDAHLLSGVEVLVAVIETGSFVVRAKRLAYRIPGSAAPSPGSRSGWASG